MERLDGVVEITDINISILLGSELVLGLGDQNLMLSISEVLTLICVYLHIVTPNLGTTDGCVTVPTLNAYLDIMIL